MKSSGAEKQRVSVMLLGDSDGLKYPPTVVYKLGESKLQATKKSNWAKYNGFSKEMHESLSFEANKYNIDVYANGCGWFTEAVVLKWLKRHFAINTTEKKLLLLDDFNAHKTEQVKRLATRLNVELMYIPPGLKSCSQPADLSWNGPLKAHLRSLWHQHMTHHCRSGGVDMRRMRFGSSRSLQDKKFCHLCTLSMDSAQQEDHRLWIQQSWILWQT